MSDTMIFLFGVVVTLLLLGGLLFTIREFRNADESPREARTGREHLERD